jgi:hypothetical protein
MSIFEDLKIIPQDAARIYAELRRWREEFPSSYNKREHFLAGFMIGYTEALKDLAKKENALRAAEASIQPSEKSV